MLFLFAAAGRNLNGNPDVKIAAFASASGQPFALHAQLMSLLSSGGDFHGNSAFQRPH
jgi:hypothetical protein